MTTTLCVLSLGSNCLAQPAGFYLGGRLPWLGLPSKIALGPGHLLALYLPLFDGILVTTTKQSPRASFEVFLVIVPPLPSRGQRRCAAQRIIILFWLHFLKNKRLADDLGLWLK